MVRHQGMKVSTLTVALPRIQTALAVKIPGAYHKLTKADHLRILVMFVPQRAVIGFYSLNVTAGSFAE